MAEQQIQLPVTGMTCASCVGRVEKAIKKVPGVVDASVNLSSEQAAVRYDPAQVAPGQLLGAIERAGYALGLPLFLLSMARDFGLIGAWLTPFWAAIEAQMGHAGETNLMHYPASADLLNWLFLALATPVQFYSGRDFYIHAWKALRN